MSNTQRHKKNTARILYQCDICNGQIFREENRARCLECGVDICYTCYQSKKEGDSHKSTHKALLIPGKINSSSSDKSDIDELSTECEDFPSDIPSFLSQMQKTTSESEQDKREWTDRIDVHLALEILDGICYFHFDFEGIARVLSKRISTSLIASYIYNVVLFDSQSIPSFSSNESHSFSESECENTPITYSWDNKHNGEKEHNECETMTVLEYLTREMNPSSCDCEMLFALKEVEPTLHQTFIPFLPTSHILSLLTFTMNKPYMTATKNRLLQLQKRLFHCEWNEKRMRKLLMQYVEKTFFFLSTSQTTPSRSSRKRKRLSSKKRSSNKQ